MEAAVLRPGQDGHRPGLHRGLRPPLPQRRPHHPSLGGAGRHLPVDLPLLRCRRGTPGPGPRVDVGRDQGLGPGPGPPDRARDDAQDDRADHVRRGARAHGAPPGRRAPCLPGLGLTGGDRPPAGRSARCGRRHLLAGRSTNKVVTRATWPSTPTGSRRRPPSASWPRTGIDLAASSVYSDSATDVPMLEAVGRPVAVNADRALARNRPRTRAGRCATSPSPSGSATVWDARLQS